MPDKQAMNQLLLVLREFVSLEELRQEVNLLGQVCARPLYDREERRDVEVLRE